MSSNLVSLTATQAVRLIHDGKLRALRLIDAYLDHIAHRDPAVRALTHFDPARPAPPSSSAKLSPPSYSKTSNSAQYEPCNN
jgi:Asp-tRNA(Asn)/Glu-tRNA(Gln) amidotransferase A subunit family amidase